MPDHTTITPRRNARKAAEVYMSRGWSPVPLPPRQKKCTITDWQKGGFKPEQFSERGNVAILTGQPSGGLVDVDLDIADQAIATELMPPTDSIFGRHGKPSSHRLYYCDPPGPYRQWTTAAGKMIVELRADGRQTMAPPSIHPTGEQVEWVRDQEPARVPWDALEAACEEYAQTIRQTLGEEPAKPPAPHRQDYAPRNDQPQAYIKAAIDGVLKELSQAAEGSRNNSLNAAAFRLGQFIGAGALARHEVEAMLSQAAIATGLREAEARQTIQSGLNAGEREPAQIPEAEPHRRQNPKNQEAPTTWPDPIPLDAAEAPPLPDGIFRYWLGDFIAATAEATETPPELSATFALAAVAATVQGQFSVLVTPNYFEPLPMWLVGAMTSGNRKSEVMKRSISPLAEWESQQAAALLPQIEAAESARKTADARISRLRADAAKASAEKYKTISEEIAQLEATRPEIPTVPRLFAQDVTPEHLGTMLAANGEHLAIISDEGGIFDTIGGRYSNGIPNLDVFLQAHAGSFVRVDRGSRPPVNLQHPTLTVAVSPQPDVLAGLTAHRGFRGRGLLARFAYMVPHSNLGFRTGNTRPTPESVTRAYADSLHSLASISPRTTEGGRPLPYVLTLVPEAVDLWRRFWSEVEAMMRPEGRLAHLTDWGGKLPGLVARIAGNLHVAAHATVAANVLDIEANTMAAAIRFGNYLIEHALIAFGMMGADQATETARDLWRIIERNRAPRFTLRDAWHPLRTTYKAVGDAEPGFDVLLDHAYIAEPHQGEQEARRRGRPPGRVFIVNPQLAKGW